MTLRSPVSGSKAVNFKSCRASMRSPPGRMPIGTQTNRSSLRLPMFRTHPSRAEGAPPTPEALRSRWTGGPTTDVVVGAVLGTSNTTSYVESGAGIQQGGRTGLTAVACAVYFTVMGGISLVRQLLFAGLLDELHLLVHPVAVGPVGDRDDQVERIHLRECPLAGRTQEYDQRRVGQDTDDDRPHQHRWSIKNLIEHVTCLR